MQDCHKLIGLYICPFGDTLASDLPVNLLGEVCKYSSKVKAQQNIDGILSNLKIVEHIQLPKKPCCVEKLLSRIPLPIRVIDVYKLLTSYDSYEYDDTSCHAVLYDSLGFVVG